MLACSPNEPLTLAPGPASGAPGSSGGAAQLAQDAGVKKLVLIHVRPSLSRDTPFESHVGEITPMYDGEITFSEELMRIED
ncbi:MAG TPA: hypothetical protein EYM77_03990 [Dehalococcoidia bacterium]|nr:hypothetical protein [Dehalococcoidia bacterium]